MLWFIYWDGHFVGTVIAEDEAGARAAADEKFGPIWGIVECVPRNVHARRRGRGTRGRVEEAAVS